jgi:hypothetical protein
LSPSVNIVLCLGGNYAIPVLLFWWLYFWTRPEGDTTMAKMTSAEQANAVNKLTEAGCPDDLKAKLVAGSPWSVIQAILAFIAAHPGLGADVWALIQALIAGGGLPA